MQGDWERVRDAPLLLRRPLPVLRELALLSGLRGRSIGRSVDPGLLLRFGTVTTFYYVLVGTLCSLRSSPKSTLVIRLCTLLLLALYAGSA